MTKRLAVLLSIVILEVIAGLFLFGIAITWYLIVGCFVAAVYFYIKSRKHPMKQSDWATFIIIVGVIVGLGLVGLLSSFLVYY